VVCAEAAYAAAQADGSLLDDVPTHIRDSVTTTVYVALEALNILYTVCVCAAAAPRQLL